MRRLVPSLFASTFLCSALALPMLAGCVVSMGGCNWQSANYTKEHLLAVPHIPATGLDVQTENGKITVRRGGSSEVSIKAIIRATSQARADAALITAGRSAGADASGANALVVRPEWPDQRREASEGCSFEITIPETAWVRLNSSNGGLSIENLAGTADLITSNASIQIASHQGDVKADTSNASIRAAKIAGSLSADTSNASLDIDDVEGFVRAKTSNASVSIALAPSSKGPVDVKSSNGSLTLRLPTTFPGTLELKTSNGRIRHEGFSAVTYSGSKTSGTLTFPAPGEASTAHTSNASITISPR
jgi:hypothetical protein